MIPIRLPWRPRARPSATLHEIPAHSFRADLGSDTITDRAVCQEGIYYQWISQTSGRTNIASALPRETVELTAAPARLHRHARLGTEQKGGENGREQNQAYSIERHSIY